VSAVAAPSRLAAEHARLLRFANAVRLVWRVQWKTGFPVIYAVLGVLTVVALRATPLSSYRELLLPAIQLGEYGTLALMLVAAHRYLERSEQSEMALLVTPLRRAEYVGALIVGSALLPTAVGVGVQAAALGPDWRILLLPLPLLLTSTFCGSLAVVLATRHDEFTSFLIGSFIPAIVVLSLPFFSYFDVLPRGAFFWLPTDAAIFAFATSVAASPSAAVLVLSLAALLFWNAVALLAATRALDRALRESAP
jgi:hypothetical protein